MLRLYPFPLHSECGSARGALANEETLPPLCRDPMAYKSSETSFLKEFRENVRDTERVCQRAVWDENQRILIDTYPISGKLYTLRWFPRHVGQDGP